LAAACGADDPATDTAPEAASPTVEANSATPSLTPTEEPSLEYDTKDADGLRETILTTIQDLPAGITARTLRRTPREQVVLSLQAAVHREGEGRA